MLAEEILADIRDELRHQTAVILGQQGAAPTCYVPERRAREILGVGKTIFHREVKQRLVRRRIAGCWRYSHESIATYIALPRYPRPTKCVTTS